jgi:hypothetical protein
MKLRKGEHGIQNLFIYPIKNGAFVTGIEQLGSRGVTRDVSQEITNFFADNRIHLQVPGAKSTSGEITAFQFDEEVYTEILGFHKNANGGFSDSASLGNFGMAFATKMLDGNKQEWYKVMCLYDNTATEPGMDIVTDEDAGELTELVLPYTGKQSDFIKDDKGNPVSFFYFDMPIGSSEEDVITLLSAGIPKPTGDLGIKNLAKGSFGDTTTTVDSIEMTYSYSKGDEIASDVAINLYLGTDTEFANVIDTAPTPAQGTNLSYTFEGLEANTTYVMRMTQGTRLLAEGYATTLTSTL